MVEVAGWSWKRRGLLSLVLLLGFGACDGVPPRTTFGEKGAFGDGQAFTWANINSDQNVREFGVTMPMRALGMLRDGFALTLALPTEVQSTIPIHSVMIEFKQRQILPDVYRVPRLEVRFFAASAAELKSIDCLGEPMPSPAVMPAPYVIESTALEPAGSCVPGLGVHAVDSSAPELHPQRDVPFQNALMLGYHRGRLIFIDPTQPIEASKQGKAFEAGVPRPGDIAAGIRWPVHAMVVPNAYTTILNFSLGQIETR